MFTSIVEVMMPSIPYDPSRVALDSPQLRDTVFVPGAEYDEVALSVELARLAYVHYEDHDAGLARLKEALGRVRFGDVTIFEDPATGTQGFGASRSSDGLCVLAFRGTEPTQLTDLGADSRPHTDRLDRKGGPRAYGIRERGAQCFARGRAVAGADASRPQAPDRDRP